MRLIDACNHEYIVDCNGGAAVGVGKRVCAANLNFNLPSMANKVHAEYK
jgi:hypothetical protein